jgi:hypothetical protein
MMILSHIGCFVLGCICTIGFVLWMLLGMDWR